MKQVASGALLISTGGALLWLFLKIKNDGMVCVEEPRDSVLAIEIIMCAAIMLFGLVRAGSALRKAWRGK